MTLLRILCGLLVLPLLLLLLPVDESEARRLGGGRSLGRSAPNASQPAAPQRQATTAQRQNPNGTAPRSGASRWLGPLAGLAAGGLLAALLFGDAFDGFQLLDFVILALLVFLGIKVIRALRGSSAPVARTAHATPGQSAAPLGGFEARPGGGGEAEQLQGVHRPGWFDEAAFLGAARTHFIRLQAAWDKGDMQDIREYTTPELFAELTLERQSYGGEDQFTEVIELDAELLDLVREGDRVVASVRFSGLIREARGAEARPFSEIWHIQRKENEPGANWYVAGIEQTGGR